MGTRTPSGRCPNWLMAAPAGSSLRSTTRVGNALAPAQYASAGNGALQAAASAALSEWLVGQQLGHAAVVMGAASMTRNPVSAIAAQNSAARPGSPRRCGSASGRQTSVTSTARPDQAGPALPQEPGTVAVVTVSGERSDQRPRVTQDHAEAAPPTSSRAANRARICRRRSS